MIPIEDANDTSLAKAAASAIAKPKKPLSIGQLERALLGRFPREDAEPWDRMGLLVGDPAALVTGVACALDPTLEAIAAAEKAGANVLLTHHPVFLDPPESFSPSFDVANASGVVVYTAASRGVALMNFHTALDAQPATLRLLPGMLNLSFERVLAPIDDTGAKGYGAVCRVRDEDAPFKLSHLAARCTSVFGRMPRVWGDFSQVLERVVVANGSAGSLVGLCCQSHVDCLVCGEVKYHAAVDAAQAGLPIVELGHDVSELPLAALLASAAVEAGVPSDSVTVIEQGHNWVTPETVRL